MEGAQTFKILAGSSQGHMLADNLRDVYAIPDLVDDVVRNQALAHSGPRLHTAESNHSAGLVGNALNANEN